MTLASDKTLKSQAPIENSSTKETDLAIYQSELVENVQITDSNRNLKVLALIYYSVYGKNDIYDKIISYIDLLEKRNKLAHITQEKEGDNFIFRNKKDNSKTYILTVEESLLLRKSILDLDNVFKNINWIVK